MKYIIVYKIAEGNKTDFEKKINEYSKDGYVWCGTMNAMPTREGMHYSILVNKSIRIKD